MNAETSEWIAVLCVLACAWLTHGSAVAEGAGVRFSPGTFSADEDCQWASGDAPALRMNAYYIAAPKPGEDRAAWLAALRTYRDEIRKGSQTPIVRMDYQGVRAWVRMAPLLAKAYDLQPGEALRVAVDARRVEGNRELCVAFDRRKRSDDAWTGWTGVCATLSLPEDGAWQRIEITVPVPAFDAAAEWLRPIVGMDATHDAAKGRAQIRHIAFSVDDGVRMAAAAQAAAALPILQLDRSLYDRKEMAWPRGAFACHFTFLYDRAFYDPARGTYTLDAFLRDGRQAFGGYDAIVLWHAYPRLGFDDRSQFDMYRDMPGGLSGLRDLIGQAHAGGVKVFIDYNPWDTGTRREGKSDEEALAEMIGALDADGIFLDTMVAGSPTLRQRIDAVKPGVVFEPEGHPSIEQLGICGASWAQGLPDPEPPGLLHLKWIEPRHMQHQIRRWDAGHRDEIEAAFFNGSGMLIWENIFGTHNPWTLEDCTLWRRAVRILRMHEPLFVNDNCDPFYPALSPNLFANHWQTDGKDLFTLVNRGDPLRDAPLIDIPAQPDTLYYDLWNGNILRPQAQGATVRIIGSVDRLGCILAIRRNAMDPGIGMLVGRQRQDAQTDRARGPRNSAASVIEPIPVEKTAPVSQKKIPPGMVLVPAATFRMQIEHVRRECGCYPDPGTPPERWREFLCGSPFDGTIRHDIASVTVAPFFIDEAEVTNAEFRQFLDVSGYHPKHPENFLKHWPRGEIPAELADHPVVYVDIDDARAYARWAGKRLPTEPEWHLAAQGTDGRKWPWGNEFDLAKCNTTKGTLPVRSCPEGRSPCGCYHMSGNVWEWTESVRDDGHTRFAIVRGGSFYKAEGSIWYADGGPQPCTHHAKFLLLWPGLDRCATIGFRCVIDAEQS